MITKVQKWGNSRGLHSQPVHQRGHRRIRIEDLVNRMPADYQAAEANWGAPVGKETW